MTAGVGEDGGLHTAPLVPQATAEALPDALVVSTPSAADADSSVPDSSAPDSSAPEATAPDVAAFSVESTAEAAESSRGSVTQALPLVRRDGTGEPPSVRAVARRVPSALPALGRDEIIDAPHSARITADRRRRAVAESRADASPESNSVQEVSTVSAADPAASTDPAADPEAGSDVSVAAMAEPSAGVTSVGPAEHAADAGEAAGPASPTRGIAGTGDTAATRTTTTPTGDNATAEPGVQAAELVVEPVSQPVRAVEFVIEPLPPAEFVVEPLPQPSRRPHASSRPTARRNVAQPSRRPHACRRPMARHYLARLRQDRSSPPYPSRPIGARTSSRPPASPGPGRTSSRCRAAGR